MNVFVVYDEVDGIATEFNTKEEAEDFLRDNAGDDLHVVYGKKCEIKKTYTLNIPKDKSK